MIILLAGTCLTGAAIGAGVCYAIMAGVVRKVVARASLYLACYELALPLAKIGAARRDAIERQNAKRRAERAGRVK